MKRRTSKDEFFDQQPPLSFVEYLRAPVHAEKPARFGRTEPEEGEVSVDGLFLENTFPDPEGLLQTVTADLERFASVCAIAGRRYPIRLQKGLTPCFEAYTVTVGEQECVITAADTEGIRRGLIYLEDEMIAREGALLPLGKIERRPWLKERITRGFFSPTNRPPKNGDELSDEIDYYPPEYLNRLMHDGTNGLWIYTSFAQLVHSDIITEYGEGSERRIEKLNRVIAKCASYGIKVYVFAIEPAGIPEEMQEKYADMLGQKLWGNKYVLCPHSERAQAYCYEATSRLFTLCPGLSGLISITAGERPTTCASPSKCTCPRCASMSRGEVLDAAVEMMRRGIRAVKPEADYVSWTYEHRNWQDPDILDYVKGAPEDVMLMQNFDDRGFQKQLGRERVAMDYWLSYPGPSGMFEMTARAAKKYKKHLWAKMQICCSHEIATLPYVPSPGNVYQKMRGAHRYGVEGLMECWYFGNYPCFMSKAAGDLSFLHDFRDEEAYLHRLASITYGRSLAAPIVKAWRLFEKGYKLYPINIMFSYYSPMHDAPVWELSLKPKNFSPSRSWLLMDKPDGDRICDSMLVGHTYDEVLTLIGRMKNCYEQAMTELSLVSANAGAALTDLLSVSSAFLVLCRSAYNVLRFYKLRDQLGTGETEPHKTLAQMRTLIAAEIENCHTMSTLCEQDNRLGYHSEAEGFKFFPAKLAHRAEQLRTLLATEFVEVEERLAEGKAPLEYYLGIEEDVEHSYTIRKGGIDAAVWEPLGTTEKAFRLAVDERDLILDVRSDSTAGFVVVPEFRLFRINASIYLGYDGAGKVVPQPVWSEHWSLEGERRAAEIAKWRVETLPDEEGLHRFRVRYSLKDADLRGTAPFKLQIFSYDGPCWEEEPICPIVTLGKYHITPGRYGWVFFEDGEAYPEKYLKK